MAKDPAFLFYSQDFYLGTATLSFEDRGKFITLLCLMHQKGRMSYSSICHIVATVSPELRLMFEVDDQGLWYNKRLEEEATKRSAYSESRRKNGSLGGKAKAKTGVAYAKHMRLHMGNHMEDENEDENETINAVIINDEFSTFWKAYPKKVGKGFAEKVWKKLRPSKTLVQEILQAIEEQKQSKKWLTNEGQYIPNPTTWLNGKSWQDTLEKPNGKNGIQSTGNPSLDALAEWSRRQEAGEPSVIEAFFQGWNEPDTVKLPPSIERSDED